MKDAPFWMIGFVTSTRSTTSNVLSPSIKWYPGTGKPDRTRGTGEGNTRQGEGERGGGQDTHTHAGVRTLRVRASQKVEATASLASAHKL